MISFGVNLQDVQRMLDFCRLWATAAITSFRGAQPRLSTAMFFKRFGMGLSENLVESKAKHDLSSFPSEK